MSIAVVAAFLAVLVAGTPISAVAGGMSGVIGAPGAAPPRGVNAADRYAPRLTPDFPGDAAIPQLGGNAPARRAGEADHRSGHRHGDRRGHRPHNVTIVNSVVVVSPPAHCWVPGYWTYHWVPQATTTHAWVPGYWASSDTWIDGQWQPQVVTTGSWQPIWVPDSWAC